MSKREVDSRFRSRERVTSLFGLAIAFTGALGVSSAIAESGDRQALSSQVWRQEPGAAERTAIEAQINVIERRQGSNLLSGLGLLAIGVGVTAASVNRIREAFPKAPVEYYNYRMPSGLVVPISLALRPEAIAAADARDRAQATQAAQLPPTEQVPPTMPAVFGEMHS